MRLLVSIITSGALLVLWAPWAGILHAQSQILPRQVGNVPFETYTITDGLPSTGIRQILQDDQGFLWVWTWAGLVKYDGYTFATFRPEAGDSVVSGRANIAGLYEDTLGRIWIITGEKGGRLFRFDRDTEQFVSYPYDLNLVLPPINNAQRYYLHESPSSPGVLWIGMYEGLVRLDLQTGATRRYQPNPGGGGSNAVWSIVEDRKGTFWVGAWGLLRFDPETGTFTSFLPDPFSPTFDPATRNRDANVVRAIQEDRQGGLWVGTNGGLYHFNRRTGAFKAFRSYQAWDPVQTLYVDRKDILWVGLYSGKLLRLDRDTERLITAGEPGGPGNSISALFEDRSGLLWVGITNRGLVKLDRHAPYFQVYPYKSKVVVVGQEGLLWFGTHGDGLYALDRDTGAITHYVHDPADPSSLSGDVISELYVDRAGTLWVGVVPGRLNSFNRTTGRFTRYTHEPWSINAVLEDRAGRLWIGTWGAGLHKLDRMSGRFASYRDVAHRPDSLSGPDLIVPLHEDRAGTLWIGTRDGVSRFDPETGTFINYHAPDLRRIIDICEDAAGRLWLGSAAGGGLHLFDRETGTSTAFTTRDGLAGNNVRNVLADDQGALWISTANGLSRFDPETRTFTNYDTSDGLPSPVFVPDAAYKSRSGELFFSTVDGIVAFFPDQVEHDPEPPPVALTDFRISDEAVPIGDGSPLKTHISQTEEVTLSYDQRDVTLTFAALSYSHPEKNRYAFRLVGYDDGWREAGTQRTATYTNLDPGAYTFRVKASNSDGIWNEEGATLDLTVLPPWWGTWWAYALYLVSLFTLVFGGHRWRLRRLERHARELRRMVKDRTRELVAEQKKTEAQARRLLELDEAKSRFFANISHEFRTPLTLILGPLHDVLDSAHGPLSPAVRRQLLLMQRSSTRLHHLIDQLLDLSKLDSGRMVLQARRRDLIPFLRALVLSFSPLAERQHVTLQFRAEVQTLPLAFDADKLEKVVVNLLSNAFKFTPEGGRVRVSVGEGTDGQGSFAEMQVRDTGRGIAPDELPYVFDRFYQADASAMRVHEGTGIGLALARELVALHGGTIRAESEEGFGSLFVVRIPSSSENGILEALESETGVALWLDEEEDGPAEALTEAEPEEAPREAPKILIVEDNADVRAYVTEHLGGCYHVIEAADGLDGLEQTRTARPDLVISDVMMPKMDGVALCRAIKQDEQLNHIPVILLTAKASEDAEVEGLAAGADDYVIKPFRAEALLARAENLIEIRRCLRQRFSGEVVLQPSAVVVPSEEAVFLERVREVVEAHLGDEHFTVEWLADEVGLSPRQLYRRLRAWAHLTPAGFIRMMRLDRAAQLLEQHSGTISEIAYRVGFKDPHYFSRLFHQTFGISPSEYSTHRS